MISHDILVVGGNDLLTPIETLSLTILMTSMAALMFFMIRDYSKRVKTIRVEYQRARTIISEILVEINRRIEEVKSSLAQNRLELSDTTLKIRGLESETFSLREILQRKADNRMVEGRIDKMEARAKEIEERIKEFMERIKPSIHKEMVAPRPSKVYSQELNVTMKKILKSLELGSKNYKEIQEVTGLSREHVSRELKKLFDMGFLNRDESKRPYIYTLIKETIIDK